LKGYRQQCKSWHAISTRFGNVIRIILPSILRSDATGFASFELGIIIAAIGLREGDVVAWFWIGTHEEYNRFRF
jgi:hypothetical protein